MFNRKKRLLLEQMDRKLDGFKDARQVILPQGGWIRAIRKGINMSLEELGKRSNRSAQNVASLEKSESNGTITLQSMNDLAAALDLQLVYGFVPREGSLLAMVEKRAEEVAKTIVNRSAQTMDLEDQSTTKDDLSKAVDEKKNELLAELPKYLWR